MLDITRIYSYLYLKGALRANCIHTVDQHVRTQYLNLYWTSVRVSIYGGDRIYCTYTVYIYKRILIGVNLR